MPGTAAVCLSHPCHQAATSSLRPQLLPSSVLTPPPLGLSPTPPPEPAWDSLAFFSPSLPPSPTLLNFTVLALPHPHPPSLQLCQATNQGRQLWGRARGRGALTASSGLGLGGCGQGPARRKREEASGKNRACGQGQPQRCSAGLEDIEQMRPRPSSPGQEAGGAGRGEGGGRQDAWGCRARGPGERARETGTRVAPGWRREQAERKPGQGQRGKRQGADEIQEEEEVDEDEAGPPAGSGGGGGGGGREKRLAGS